MGGYTLRLTHGVCEQARVYAHTSLAYWVHTHTQTYKIRTMSEQDMERTAKRTRETARIQELKKKQVLFSYLILPALFYCLPHEVPKQDCNRE